MEKDTKYIFDMDGTLYHFDATAGTTFHNSRFCRDLIQRTYSYLSSQLELDLVAATELVEDIQTRYDGHLSLGLEKEHNISRDELFSATWDCDPAQYVAAEPSLAETMSIFRGRSALLTAAPRVWADRVLAYLGIADVFEDRIFTGEPDIRKPDPRAFEIVARSLGADAPEIISVGDQNHTDILPALKLGMRTAIIGPDKQDAHLRADTVLDLLPQLIERKLL